MEWYAVAFRTTRLRVLQVVVGVRLGVLVVGCIQNDPAQVLQEWGWFLDLDTLRATQTRITTINSVNLMWLCILIRCREDILKNCATSALLPYLYSFQHPLSVSVL